MKERETVKLSAAASASDAVSVRFADDFSDNFTETGSDADAAAAKIISVRYEIMSKDVFRKNLCRLLEA